MATAGTGPRLRRAARALIIDPDDRVLLAPFDLPHTSLWAAPGGGLEGDETNLDALRRELREEVGIDLPADPPPHVWHRTVVIAGVFAGYDGQVEDYYLLRTDRFEPRGDLTDEELAAEHMGPLRWWTPAELAAADPTTATFAPRSLPELVADLLVHGPPPAPLSLTW